MMSEDDRFPATTIPDIKTPESRTRIRQRRVLQQRELPTGLPSLLTGVIGFIALLYFQHRSASPWAMAACSAFAGAGLALLLAAHAGHGRPSWWQAAGTGGLAGLTLIVTHMSITNPDACAVAWTAVLAFGVPRIAGVGAGGSAALVVALRGRGGTLPARGGDRMLLAVLLVAVIACGVAMYPFAHNALAYSRLATGAALVIQPVSDAPGAGSVVAGGRVLVLQPWLYEQVAVEVYGLDGAAGGRIGWTLPEGAGSVRILVDELDGLAYVGWVEPVRAPKAQPGSEQVWRTVLARLDGEAGEVSQTWAFPVESAWGRLDLVHGGHAVLAGEGEVICYALGASRDSPVELWRADAPGTELMRAAATTLIVASYGAQPACYHLPTGQRLWQVDGEAVAAPVYDHANHLWIVATRDSVIGLSAGEGAVWAFPRRGQARDRGPAGLFAHAGQLMVMERDYGPAWDWPPVNVSLAAYSAADGRKLWETKVERDAFYFAGQVRGVTMLGGMYGLLLGVEDGGAPVFRVRVGPVSAVVERPDGALILLSESGGFKVGRLRR